MWPWEHLAVGYLLLSVVVRATYERPPGEAAVFVLLIGTQLPDLVDKPLAWEFGVFAGGQALAHSAFVAVPVGAAGVLVGRSRGRTESGLALLVGYWSHLAADVADPLRYGNGIAVERILWPFVETRPYSEDLGVGRGLVYLREFVADLLAGGVSGPNLLYLLLPGIAFALWIVDGLPGVATLARAVRPR